MRRLRPVSVLLALALLAPARARANADACYEALFDLTSLDSSRAGMIYDLIGKGDAGVLLSREMIASYGGSGTAQIDAIAALLGIQRGTSGVTSWGNLDAITSSDLGLRLVTNPVSRGNLTAAQLDTIVRSDAVLKARRIPLNKKVGREDGFYGSMMVRRAQGTITPDQNAVVDLMFPGMDGTAERNFFWTDKGVTAAVNTGLIRQAQPGYTAGTFLNNARLTGHFNDHGAEFGYATSAQYLAGAQAMVGRTGPGILQFEVVTDGMRQISKYDAATGGFLVFNADPPHTIQTFFKVDGRHGCRPQGVGGFGGLGGLVYFLRHCNQGSEGTAGAAPRCKPSADGERVGLFGCN